MRLAQFVDENGKRALAVTARGESRMVKGARSTLDLARQAIDEEVSLRKLIADRGVGKPVDLRRALKERRVLPPIDHKDPAHVFVTGTGLTHLGSAEGRDQMHRDLADPCQAHQTRCACSGSASMAANPEEGRRAPSRSGSTRATVRSLLAPEGDLKSPSFALDGGEEPEIVGVYVIDRRRQACSRRVRARQRVLRSRHRAAELSLARPFQIAPCERRPGVARRRSSRRRSGGLADPARAGRSSGKSRSSPANRIWRTRSPISRRTISNTRFSGDQAMSTFTSSALQLFRSARMSGRRRATFLRSSPNRSVCRCATG